MGGGVMDFIERWFDVAPDGGNGTLEVLAVAAVCVGILVLAFHRRILGFGRPSRNSMP
jgi:hypothetical protein